MRRGLFVTGTDTNVGKTAVSAALMHRYRHLGLLRYWKPIQTGIEQDDDTAVVQQLGACSQEELFTAGVRLPRPLSPHLAAQLNGTRISLPQLAQLIAAQPTGHRWVIEGAGGALVPINESKLMIDLMVQLSVPVVVVARSALGTINHTLLTLQALRSRSLCVAGIVVVGDRNRDNCAAIEQFGAVPILGEMPRFSRLSAEGLRQWASSELDQAEHLLSWLQ